MTEPLKRAKERVVEGGAWGAAAVVVVALGVGAARSHFCACASWVTPARPAESLVEEDVPDDMAVADAPTTVHARR